MTRSLKWIKKHLICEFRHWDVCLVGLIRHKERYMLCRIVKGQFFDRHSPKYMLHDIAWTDECSEYLDDYRKAYRHWFYEGGNRTHQYDGSDLSWFGKKWKTNPIEDAASVEQV